MEIPIEQFHNRALKIKLNLFFWSQSSFTT